MAYRRTPPRTSPRRTFPTTSIREPPRGDLFRGQTPKMMQPPKLGAQGKAIAEQMLHEFGQMMNLNLVFGHNDTCMINYEGTPVLITYDQPTERIYVYGNLIHALPTELDDKVALYEFLLEGCLLGRDMSGGGVGVSLKNDFCLMGSSFDIRNSESHALKVVVPAFVQSFSEWKQRIQAHPVIVKLNHQKALVEQQEQQQEQELVRQEEQAKAAARAAEAAQQAQAAAQQAQQAAEQQAAEQPQQQQQPQQHQHSPQHVEQRSGDKLAQATERKMKSKALLIGIDYLNTQYQLIGCCEDARTMKEFLQKNGFEEASDILLLTDDNPDPNFHPTKANIINGLQWLVTDVQTDDSLFLTYSGMARGEQDLSSTAPDAIVKALCPSDFPKYGTISEDETYDIVIRNLPKRCAFNAVFDCANTLFDMGMAWMYAANSLAGLPNEPLMVQAGLGPRQAFKLERANQEASICVIASSYDRMMAKDRANCRFTKAFTTALTRKPEQSYMELSHSIAQLLIAAGGMHVHKSPPCLFSPVPLPLMTTYTI